MNKLADFGNIPFLMSSLSDVYPGIKALAVKAKRLEDAHDIIRLKKGLYIVSPSISGVRMNEFLIANHLYGPSYVSMQSALRYYGLIPERVVETISVTLGLAKTYENEAGRFRYIHSGADYYSVGLQIESIEGVNFLIASPEKALVDMINYTPNLRLRSLAEVRRYLEEDLRIDSADIEQFDAEILRDCLPFSRKKMIIQHLIQLIENERNI